MTALVEQPRQAFIEQIMGLPISVHVRGPAARGPQVALAVGVIHTSLKP